MRLLFTITILVALFSIYWSFNNHTTYPEIEILDKETTAKIIKSNKEYFNSMHSNDYKVRQITKIEDYYEAIDNSVIDISDKEKSILKEMIDKADNKINGINLKWFDGKKANQLKWKIGFIQGRMYEYGLPHTIKDTIILNRNNLLDGKDLINTLVHEKVHIYQKAYPEDVKLYLEINRFIPIKEREEKDNIRANPDINNIIYKRDNIIYSTTYNVNPKNILDTKERNQYYEHPFETMAIEIAN
jgi:hypothetical protein